MLVVYWRQRIVNEYGIRGEVMIYIEKHFNGIIEIEIWVVANYSNWSQLEGRLKGMLGVDINLKKKVLNIFWCGYTQVGKCHCSLGNWWRQAVMKASSGSLTCFTQLITSERAYGAVEMEKTKKSCYSAWRRVGNKIIVSWSGMEVKKRIQKFWELKLEKD